MGCHRKFSISKEHVAKHGWIAYSKVFPEHIERTDERIFTRSIRPLRPMNAKSLPKKLCDNLFNDISPTMNLMEDAPEIRIDHSTIIDDNFIIRKGVYSLGST